MKRFDWVRSRFFPHTFDHCRTTLHLQAALPTPTREALAQVIGQASIAKRVSKPLECLHSRLFVKRERLDSLRKKWRIQRGVRKRNGLFDWSLEELINTREANLRGARVPKLKGYGYSHSALGLPEHFYLLIEHLEDHIDGYNWVMQQPQRVNELIETAFELLHSLHGRGVSHMDLWAGNLMLPVKGNQPAQAVDLENCFVTPTNHFTEVLAFQIGFFYYRQVYRFITETEYDALVEDALKRYFTNVQRDLFDRIYAIAKHQDVGRLERRDIFHSGKLQARW
ncbi:lipopolysaccharide kinase InaA family protein [Pseudomonas sp. MH2]|uniref:Lipopolysaccharide kinase InaA family protein n=1 Tax=Pseudomonas machongensis TaxID=3110229 RepID=A0ABU5VBJ1_9PSED|nr:lipopolysaccharide kinase InaA family protein [Pseudomonas sp. MH2]MEA5669830.1 lipopolysaccharide kinase InaA family protein [Pseudomonas sp. MH2]